MFGLAIASRDALSRPSPMILSGSPNSLKARTAMSIRL